MKKLAGKWAFVTGSSRGIGQQIAVGLAKEGCNIIVHGRKLENTTKTVELLSPYNVKIDVVCGELNNKEDLHKIIHEVKGKYKVAILYNNAGIQNKYQDYWNITMDEWMDVFQINLFSVVELCNAFAYDMKLRGYGRIINLSSGIRDLPQLTPYSVSKAAIDKFTKDLAFELRNTGVLVNALDPGWLKTNLGGEWAPNEVTSVLPGAIVPALLENDGPTGLLFSAQDYNKK